MPRLIRVSNRPSRDITRAPDAETHEHATAPSDTGCRALRAFGDEEAVDSYPATPTLQNRSPGLLIGECLISYSRRLRTSSQVQEPRLSPDFIAEVNARLDLRESLRHSPNAPWRPS
jgi:hypothetical protein